MARPTEYNSKVLAKARDYLKNYEQYGDVVPTVAGLACELDFHRDTLYEWAKHEDKKDFSDILTRVMQIQERKLVSGGLVGGFNPAVTKMMLTKHGYSDKQELDHSSKDGSMSPLVVVLDSDDDE